MRKFQCLLFVLKQSCICYYVICMTVALRNIYLKKCTPNIEAVASKHESNMQILGTI